VEYDHLKLILTEDTPRKPRRKFGKGNPAQSMAFDFMQEGPGDE